MKTTQTFAVRMIALPKKSNLNEAFIFARITISKKVIDISLKRTTLCSLWDSKRECINSKTPEAKQINKFIDDTRYRLMECYQQLLLEHKVISPQAIKTLYLGDTKVDNTLLGLIDYHNNNMKTVLSWGTLKNYYTTRKYVYLFLLKKYKNADIFLSSLNYQFITEFEFFLRTCEPLDKSNPIANNGIMKHMERLRKMVTLAYKMEWISKDPFAQYKLRFKRKEMSFLTADELSKIENIELSKKIVLRARDLFVFSCYTGLAFVDMDNLRIDNLCIGIDGEQWIKTSRQKTETAVNLPLLPKAYAIIEKYKNEPRVYYRQRLLPFMSNQRLNKYIKDIAAICGIKKDISFHTARHTFATTVTLTNGVPVETVSKMLGHTKLSTTQIYVHVVKQKISDDMKSLKQKLVEQDQAIS
ncbi:MAG TPA: site-specific integrase, partial [Parafilimonas sp.]|nr:site-specific integrase [Parafilimonas sp.]